MFVVMVIFFLPSARSPTLRSRRKNVGIYTILLKKL